MSISGISTAASYLQYPKLNVRSAERADAAQKPVETTAAAKLQVGQVPATRSEHVPAASLTADGRAVAARLLAASQGESEAVMSKEQAHRLGQMLAKANVAAAELPVESAEESYVPMLTLKGLMGAWGQSGSPYDLNGDGTVGTADMLLLLQNGGTMPMPEGMTEPLTLKGLLAAWGTNNPTFDLNGDGTVGTADLLLLMQKLNGSGEASEPDEQPEQPGQMMTLKGLMGAWGQSGSPYDLNGDGTVGVADMLILMQNGGTMPMPEGMSEPLTLKGLMAAWGTDNPAFDLNGDGTVDESDLLLLLSKLGPNSSDGDEQAKLAASELPQGMTVDELMGKIRTNPAANAESLAAVASLIKEDEA